MIPQKIYQRDGLLLTTNHPNSEGFGKRFAYHRPKLWNRLENTLSNVPNLDLLKSMLRRTMLRKSLAQGSG